MDKAEVEIDIEDVLSLIEYHDKMVSKYQFIKNPTPNQLNAQVIHNNKLGYWKKILDNAWPK
jgi:hypothetical protein